MEGKKRRKKGKKEGKGWEGVKEEEGRGRNERKIKNKIKNNKRD